MDLYIKYNEVYKVLICCEQQCTISPATIQEHFTKKHSDVLLKICQEILEYALTLELCHPNAVIHSLEKIPAVNGLKIHDGFVCNFEGCMDIHGTKNSIRRHCSMRHKWEGNIDGRWKKCKIQTFFLGIYHR